MKNKNSINMDLEKVIIGFLYTNVVGILVDMQLDNAIRNKQAIRILKTVARGK